MEHPYFPLLQGKVGIRKPHQVLLVIWPKWRRLNEGLEEQDGSNLTNCFPTRIKVFGHRDILQFPSSDTDPLSRKATSNQVGHSPTRMRENQAFSLASVRAIKCLFVLPSTGLLDLASPAHPQARSSVPLSSPFHCFKLYGPVFLLGTSLLGLTVCIVFINRLAHTTN